MNSLSYNGLVGRYNNTVLAEISTGAGLQELLVFKGSSASDRVRVQTTGTFVVETGVSARLFNPNTTQTLSNATPAFIINTSSNVGIQTASPGAALDVAGTGRFLTMSTQQAFASSIRATTTNSVFMSTGNIRISTLTTPDQNALNPAGTVYQKSTFLYFNNFIFAGTKQAFGQILTLGIGSGAGGIVTSYTQGLTTYTVHSFTTSSNFAISGGNLYADIFVLGGGGGGGGNYGGGGGAGGFRYAPNVLLTSGNYTVTVGQGGAGSSANSTSGQDSVFSNAALSYTGFGGGGAGSYNGNNQGSNGGCGGGSSGISNFAGGIGSQGYNGGFGQFGYGGAAGGGMGGNGGASTNNPTNGGPGSTITITGTAVVYGGGGAGGSIYGGSGGSGGGGSSGGQGTDGLGGGGGGAGSGGNGARGGSGIIIIRYPPG